MQFWMGIQGGTPKDTTSQTSQFNQNKDAEKVERIEES
jgi:hypothetical protein